ncbi:DHA2 family efflux MFS transporter permease subunit [Streptomyces sp. NBC_00249]|uniref:DHA2 family efflux MFS transporter permease subunit n=1 Tax=Streptomyces sp. NBC_00249 TaxID=2975690 RepID=UPI00225B75F6|nr:DHA2 family efflux MFS transporter permease subunit [Streptomyces sp. NBC_00249]MCX5193642.1 DHA2 family efflux MFS transporter permease subunit [Streptomyces sp. NBC_00249]
MTKTTTTTTARPAPDGPASPPAVRGPLGLAVSGLMLGMFLAMVDGLIVGPALPTIVGELGGVGDLSWVVTAYLLAAAATTPLWGKAGDLFGRKGSYLCAIGLFLVGSALTGLAQSMGQLIAFRALQGLGAGGLMVGALSIIGVLVPPEQRGRVQSVSGIMAPLAFVGGPLAGGLLTEHLSWRWTFYVNIPLGLIALLIIALTVRIRTQRVKARIDHAGITLLTVAVVALTLVATWGGSRYAWTSAPVLLLTATALAALAGFVRAERRAAEPVIPPRLFADRDFTTAQILSFLVGAVMVTLSSYLPQYLQFVQGSSPTASGLLILPLLFGMLGAQLLIGHLYARARHHRRRFALLGGALGVLGTALLFLLGPGTPTAAASALTAVVGAGTGLLMQSSLLITTDSAPARDMGAASGTVTLLRTIGGSLGIALLGALYTGRLHTGLAEQLGAENAARLSGPGGELTPAALHTLPAGTRAALAESATTGLHGLLTGVLVLALAALAASFLLRTTPREARSGA